MLETERLVLRRFTNADEDAIFMMRSNAEFMRFIKKPETRKQSMAWMQMVSRYWEHSNFGFWAVVLKETNNTIGWSGSWNLRETGEKEIGFAIANEFWGRGLSTEAARAALQFTFENRRADKTVAVAMPENTASRRVMEKIGMRFETNRYFESYGLELVCYSITQNEYAGNHTLNIASFDAERFGTAD